ILVSSAPQIRYPDCYGIDMSRLGDFAAFQAAIALLKERGMEDLLADLYARVKTELTKPAEEQINLVKELYAPFSADEITAKIANMVQPKDLNARFDMVFQSIENLHQACPNDTGDWYFTGDYPTPGGTQVANRSFLYYMEGSRKRAY
ncbi:MAG: amidophosphoribosyltransferase, partial [Bacteroidia bacterium]